MANSLVSLRDKGIRSLSQLEKSIQEKAVARQDLNDNIKVIESKMNHLSKIMEHAHTVIKYREIYKYHKENPRDKHFENESSTELAFYKVTATEILKYYKKLLKPRKSLKDWMAKRRKSRTYDRIYRNKVRNRHDLYLAEEL